MIKKTLILLVVLLAVLPSATVSSQNVEITVTGIRNTNGYIAIGVFRDNETFQKEEAFLKNRFPKTGISDGELKVSITLEPGIYGISLLDDENSNGEMEYNFLGMPKEGFGFSDFYLKGITRPKFDDFKFSLDPDQKKKVTIKIRYML